MSEELTEALGLATRGFDRIKTSDLTMDGFTTFHGRLSMDEVGAINEVFGFARAHLGCSTIKPEFEETGRTFKPALVTNEQVNIEPVYWCSEHDSTTEGKGVCDAKEAWNYTSECRTQLVRIVPVEAARRVSEEQT